MKKVLLFVIVTLTVPALALAQGQNRTRDEQRRRNQIRLMEGVLVQAVRLGAEEVSTVMEGATTSRRHACCLACARVASCSMVTRLLRRRDPRHEQSVIWSMMNVQRDRRRQRPRFAAERVRVDA